MLVLQSCLTLFDPMDYSSSGSSVHGILQARIVKWVTIPFFRGIFPFQGSNPSLLHCRQILYHPSHWDSPGKNTGVGCHFLLQGKPIGVLCILNLGLQSLLIFLFSFSILLHYYKDTSFRALTLTALIKTEIGCSRVLIYINRSNIP